LEDAVLPVADDPSPGHLLSVLDRLLALLVLIEMIIGVIIGRMPRTCRISSTNQISQGRRYVSVQHR
jgi:ACR3 family arsenite efflux pump ArsB